VLYRRTELADRLLRATISESSRSEAATGRAPNLKGERSGP
jgi:hypothetical protein